MEIDWTHFTPWLSLAGGVILGLACVMLILLNGRILGISSIVGGLLSPSRHQYSWRLTFLSGLFCTPWLMHGLPLSQILIDPRVAANTPTIVIAGVLVGIGTRYGSGCTSGHGICGLSRLSVRSLMATAAFMTSGFAVVAIVRHAI
jgi:uncharacterized membrane protein YedE/YeeE